MNLWASLLLGLLAQTSDGCIQTSFPKIEEMFASSASDIATRLQGRSLPDIEVNQCGIVKAKNVTVKDASVTSSQSTCSATGYASLNVTGTVTVISSAFSVAAFGFQLYMEIAPGMKNGYYFCKLQPGSHSLSLKLTNTVYCNQCTLLKNRKEVVKSYVKECQTLLQGLERGATHSALTIMNNQHKKLTDKFIYQGLTCNYQLSGSQVYGKSLSSNVTINCDKLGPLNDGKSVTLNIMKPNETIILYVEQKLLDSVLATVPVKCETRLPEAETNNAFPPGTGEVSLSFSQSSFPNTLITPEEATATFSLDGAIKDKSGITIMQFGIVIKASIHVSLLSGIIGASLGEARIVELTPRNTDDYDTLKRLEPIILAHAKRAIKDISSDLQPFRAPDPTWITLINADCINQNGQIACVQQNSQS